MSKQDYNVSNILPSYLHTNNNQKAFKHPKNRF